MKLKSIITLALCLIVVVQGVAADKTNALVLKGQIREAAGISYEVSILNEDNSCTLIQTDQVFHFYKITLEVGRNYKIVFSKKNVVKTLIVNADSFGFFYVDVDFQNNVSGHLFYDYYERQYDLKVLPADYAENNP